MFDDFSLASWNRVCEEKDLHINGTLWRVIGAGDKDRWPSLPHAHDYENNLKLNLFNGEYFEVGTRSYKGKLTKKELARIWKLLKWNPPEAKK